MKDLSANGFLKQSVVRCNTYSAQAGLLTLSLPEYSPAPLAMLTFGDDLGGTILGLIDVGFGIISKYVLGLLAALSKSK